MNLSLSGWQTATIKETMLGEGTANVTPKALSFVDLWTQEAEVTPKK